jgi:hypothetical protein
MLKDPDPHAQYGYLWIRILDNQIKADPWGSWYTTLGKRTYRRIQNWLTDSGDGSDPV